MDSKTPSSATGPQYPELVAGMAALDCIPINVPGWSDDFLMWKNVASGKEFGLPNWESVQEYLLLQDETTAEHSNGKSTEIPLQKICTDAKEQCDALCENNTAARALDHTMAERE